MTGPRRPAASRSLREDRVAALDSGAPPPRTVIRNVYPEIVGGQYPIKRIVGEDVTVEADIFADGHEELSCWLLHRSNPPIRPILVG
ncbi:MAG: DUF3416 domain-containing protein, partial [Betaproteobacteria bacterium]|nr:DUF3416 domain-containing protein [Betaproteobacteria bacterium]